MKSPLLKIALAALTLLTFFLLLGNRPLNEPDEGRYTEIAREMIETGDWLVPHFWYLPHLDKPPLAYWLVAVSMRLFGQNEWAVRLPVALAGVSGVWATYLLGCALAGRRIGWWSALILQSAIFYAFMGRMLTTDMLLTQFTAWAMYFFWRSWTALETAKQEFFAWHLAGWVAVALGFLTKGPIALAIPVVSFLALLIFRRGAVPGRFWAGASAGFVLFLMIAAPWFLVVFQRVPQSAHYMILGQAAGHLLGTAVKNRNGFPGYFFVMLAWQLLPWTLLLGWLWRRTHWRGLDPKSKEGWLLLSVWAIFTFTLFSFSQAERAAYVLPIFPALAVLLAWRFFGGDSAVPQIIWRMVLAFSLLLPVIFPIAIFLLLHVTLPIWLKCQVPLALALVIALFILAKKWKPQTIQVFSAGLALLGFYVTVMEFPLFHFDYKANAPLDEIGDALRENYQPGEAIVCLGNLPQGLPFYSGGVISTTNRPYFCGMSPGKVPYDFPGNEERLGRLYLDGTTLTKLLKENHNVLIVSFGGAVGYFQQHYENIPLREVFRCGQWALYSNAPAPLHD